MGRELGKSHGTGRTCSVCCFCCIQICRKREAGAGRYFAGAFFPDREACHSTDEQRALVVTGRERTAERRAGLTVAHVTIGKEHTGRSGEPVADFAGLAHKAVLHLHRIDDARSMADDGILADHTRSDIHIGLGRAQDGAVAEARRTVHLTIVADVRVGYFLRIDDLHARSEGATVGACGFDFLADEPANAVFQLLVLEMFHHESGKLTVEMLKEDEVSMIKVLAILALDRKSVV